MKRFLCLVVLICLFVSSSIVIYADSSDNHGKVDQELLSVLEISEDELLKRHFEETGESFPCMLWITDIDMEPAIQFAIDCAEQTREHPLNKYSYPYEVFEIDGVKDIIVDIPDDETDIYVQTYIESKREHCRNAYQEHNNAFATSILSKMDVVVEYSSLYSPCLLAMLTRSNVYSLLQTPGITYIDYMPNLKGEDLTEYSYEDNCVTAKILDDEDTGTSGARSTYGVSGSGVKIGQLENSTPSYSNVTLHPTYNNTSSHANYVYRSMSTAAPGASYYAVAVDDTSSYGNAYVNTVLPRIEWLLDQGVNIINISWGIPTDSSYNKYTAFARWMDHIAYNHDVHVVEGAGNEGSDSNYKGVRSPAMAYNIITVGAIYLKDNSCDRLSGSSYNNLGASTTAPRTFKPDISAPGIKDTSNGQFGTSLSAPIISGTVALLCELQPSLKTKQHVVKAILSTTVNKDYHKMKTPSSNTTITGFAKYGAGVVDAKSACYCVSHSHFSTTTGSVSSSSTTKTYNMEVTSGDTQMRVSLAYANRVKFSGSNHNYVGSTPSASIGVLKLTIKDPSGNTVASCSTSGANLKVVEFAPSAYGTYKITVTWISGGAMNGSAVATNFGIAWR